MCDYRNTPFCKKLSNLEQKKEHLKKIILSQHPKQKNIYSKIHDRSLHFFIDFGEIYNNKCAYCGVSSDVVGLNNFEIDHYICKAQFDDEEKAGQITNLRFSCKFCNRKKRDYQIESCYQKILDPDDIIISSVFKRASDYRIIISEEYKNDTTIKQFYTKLAFDNQFRRIDFLLMNMINYSKKIKNRNIKEKIGSCIELLYLKKNNILFI